MAVFYCPMPAMSGLNRRHLWQREHPSRVAFYCDRALFGIMYCNPDIPVSLTPTGWTSPLLLLLAHSSLATNLSIRVPFVPENILLGLLSQLCGKCNVDGV